MTKAIIPWDELSRIEKIKHIFDYLETTRNSQAKNLWGPEASGYNEHIHFPLTAPWKEVVEVIKSSHYSHTAYVRLTDKDFKIPNPDDLRKERIVALQKAFEAESFGGTPTVKGLANYLEASERTVKRHIQESKIFAINNNGEVIRKADKVE